MESMIMIVALMAVMYFFMIRPENKRKKQAQNMRDSLKKGDMIKMCIRDSLHRAAAWRRV